MTQNIQAEMLFSLLFKNLGPNYIEVMALDRFNQTNGRPTAYKEWVTSIEDAIAFSTLHDTLRHDTYMGVIPRKNQGGKKEDVAESEFVWADFDTGSTLWQALPPTAIVYSGNGTKDRPNTHCFWQTDQHHLPTEVEETSKMMCVLGADTGGKIKADNSYEFSHRLRIPGTRNFKTVTAGRPVILSEIHPDRIYNRQDLNGFLGLKGKNRDVWKYCQTGSYVGFPGESERDFWVSCVLYEANCSVEFIAFIIENTALINRPYGEEKHSGYAALTAKNAADWVDAKLIENQGRGLRVVVDEETEDKPAKKKADKAEKIPVDTGSLDDWHEEADGTWYKKTRVANFVFDPEKLVHVTGVAEDYFIGELRAEGQVWKEVVFPRHAFNDVPSMVKVLTRAATQWYINKPELVRLYLTYVYTKLRKKGVPVVAGKLSQGRYGDTWVVEGQTVTTEGIADSSEVKMIFIEQGSEHPKVHYTQEDNQDVFLQAACLLPFLNKPDIIWPMIGWYWATYHKPELYQRGYRFPILNIHGPRGSGKTELVERVFLPMLGHTDPSAYLLSNITPAAIYQLMGSSTSIPFAFQEYRSDDKAIRYKQLLMSLARSSYDNGVDIKGKPGKQIDRTELTAPFSVDGEDPFEDDGGLTQRLLSLSPMMDDISPGILGAVPPSRAYTSFQEITKLPLQKIAGSILVHALNSPIPIERAQSLMNLAFTIDMPDRVRKNLAVSLAGILSYCDFSLKSGVPAEYIPQVDTNFVLNVFNHALRNVVSITGDTTMMCDLFVRDVWNYLMMLPPGTLSTDRTIRAHILRGGEVHVHMQSSYNWWLLERIKSKQGHMELVSLKKQLQMRIVNPMTASKSQYILNLGNVSGPTGMGSFQGFSTNYDLLRQAGMDVLPPHSYLRVEVDQ